MLGGVCQLLGCFNVLHLCISNFCKKQLKLTNVEPCVQSELSLMLEGTVSQGSFLRSFGLKDFIGRESCFKRHKVTPLGSLLSEIVSKENNRSYSSRLWAQVQAQTIALDQTRAVSWNIARFRKKKLATNLDLSIRAQSLFEHMLQSLQFLALWASRLQARDCRLVLSTPGCVLPEGRWQQWTLPPTKSSLCTGPC